MEKLEGSSPSIIRWRRLFEAHHLTEADIIREKFPVEAILQHLPEVKLNKLLRSRMLSSAERKVLGLRLSDVPPVPIKETAKRLELDHKVVMETIRQAESRLEAYLYNRANGAGLPSPVKLKPGVTTAVRASN